MSIKRTLFIIIIFLLIGTISVSNVWAESSALNSIHQSIDQLFEAYETTEESKKDLETISIDPKPSETYLVEDKEEIEEMLEADEIKPPSKTQPLIEQSSVFHEINQIIELLSEIEERLTKRETLKSEEEIKEEEIAFKEMTIGESAEGEEIIKSWPAVIRPGFLTNKGDPTTGYLDYFLPVWQDETNMFFINPKVSFSNDDAYERNIGLGFRHMRMDERFILGANVFYDRRKSKHDNRFHQVGFGLEALSYWFDARVNYYHPTTGAKRIDSLTTHKFSETSLLRFNGLEEPLRGIDYEGGVLIPFLSDILETRIYGGGFYFKSKKFKNKQGTRLRVETRPNRMLTFEVKVDYDRDFGTGTSVGAFLSLPFDLGKIAEGKNPFDGWREAIRFKKGPREVFERMNERVVRDLDIVSRSGNDQNSEKLELN